MPSGVDILLVMDTSYHMSKYHGKLTDLVEYVATHNFTNNSYFAVMSFGESATFMTNYTDDADSMLDAVRNRSNITGQPDYGEMLEQAKDVITSKSSYSRPNVRDVILVFSYGYDAQMAFNITRAQSAASALAQDPSVSLICKCNTLHKKATIHQVTT